MFHDYLKAFRIILSSGSPRRQQFFKDLEIPVKIEVKSVEETYPQHLQASDISDYLAVLKATPFKGTLLAQDILITSDTIVWHNNKALGKPKDKLDAFTTLSKLSGNSHQVITSVCFTRANTQIVVNHSTTVHFRTLTPEEINYYIDTYKPFDKAGSYGIQDWIGHIGITKIEGSYTNVMGLPTHLVYQKLEEITQY